MYKLDKIGSGVYGVIYEGKYIESEPNDKTYAVKRFYKQPNIDFIESINELDIICRLNHPFFIGVQNVFFTSPFNEPENNENKFKFAGFHLVMEKAEMSLLTFIKQLPDFDVVNGYITQLLLGVEFLHKRGIVHRDLSPSNILIQNNTIKICDMGLSMYITKQEPNNNDVFACYYRAPEICLGNVYYSFTSDIWAIGLIILEFILPSICDSRQRYDSIRFYNILILMSSKLKSDDWIQVLNQTIDTYYYSLSTEKSNFHVNEQLQWWDNFIPIFELIKGYLPESLMNYVESFICEFKSIKPYKTDITTIKYRLKFITKVRENIKSRNYNEEKHIDIDNKLSIDSRIFNTDRYKDIENNDMLKDLICRMLEINAGKRFSATQCLDHEYLKFYEEYIADVKTIYKPRNISSPEITILSCNERKWMKTIVYDILDNKEKYIWYSHRIIFHAIEIHDRYLAWSDINYEHNIESEDVGRYCGKIKSILHFYVCLYLSMKYFNEKNDERVSFTTLIPVEHQFKDFMIKAESFEHILIKDILQLQIYRKTIFEVADERDIKLTNKELSDLIKNYCNQSDCKLTMEELFNLYLKD